MVETQKNNATSRESLLMPNNRNYLGLTKPDNVQESTFFASEWATWFCGGFDVCAIFFLMNFIAVPKQI